MSNLRWDTIAWNTTADRLFSFSDREQHDRNIIRMVFADPNLRRRLPQWTEDAPRLVAQFRYDLAAAPDDPDMLWLVEDLKKVSPDFRRWMEQPGMDICAGGISGLLAEDGDTLLSFDHQMLTVDEHRHLKMIVYFPATA